MKGIVTLAALAAVSTLAGCIAAPLAIVGGATYGGLKMGDHAYKKDTQAGLPTETAAAIGRNLDPKNVKISGVAYDHHNVTWLADTPLGRYSCSQAGLQAYCLKR